MKRTLVLSPFLLLATIVIPGIKAKAIPVCFKDSYGIVWSFPDLKMTGKGTYYGEGKVDGYPGGKATIWLDFSNGKNDGSVELHAVNPSPDGCYNYSDSFIYIGSAFVYCDGEKITYDGKGHWESYCNGKLLFSGVWGAWGPCSSVKKKIEPPKGPSPTSMNQKSNENFSLLIAPNPVRNTAQLQYKLSQAANVNITIYDFMQRPVSVLVNEFKKPGNYSVSWNVLNAYGTKVTPGLYKAVIAAGDKKYSHTLQVE